MNLKDKYINPLTDFGFKKIFGVEPNKEILIDFLNQLLPSVHQIKSLTYSKNERLGKTEFERKAIFDLFCTNEKGEKFIVELQKAKQKYFKDRSVYYSTFPIQEQAEKGEWDYKLSAVYTIGILDFVFESVEENSDILHIVKLKDDKNKVFFDKLTYIYVELPKFSKKDTELKTKFDKWMYVFRHLAHLQNRPDSLQEKIFEKLFETAEIAKFSPLEIEQYEESLKNYRDLQNVIENSKNEKAIEIAKNLKKQGVSIKIIVEATGLTIEEINSL